ncbi:MAG: hypothetical protein CFH10_00538 [Alphaproteobacteria bacterium MarineAlpha4_Bin2]|nr:MAG: hypothetical protein CFH10_00538 [Alphaproteobacteria bacterium MarineAlpha4_Bin2]
MPNSIAIASSIAGSVATNSHQLLQTSENQPGYDIALCEWSIRPAYNWRRVQHGAV